MPLYENENPGLWYDLYPVLPTGWGHNSRVSVYKQRTPEPGIRGKRFSFMGRLWRRRGTHVKRCMTMSPEFFRVRKVGVVGNVSLLGLRPFQSPLPPRCLFRLMMRIYYKKYAPASPFLRHIVLFHLCGDERDNGRITLALGHTRTPRC